MNRFIIIDTIEDAQKFMGIDPNNIDWSKVYSTRYIKLSEDFVRKYADKIDWNLALVDNNLELSEKFILEHADKLDWSTIFCNQDLSEKVLFNLAEKLKDSRNFWYYVSKDQSLSIEFVKRYADKIIWGVFITHNITFYSPYDSDFDSQILEIAPAEAWKYISTIYMTYDTLMKYADKIDWDVYVASHENLIKIANLIVEKRS